MDAERLDESFQCHVSGGKCVRGKTNKKKL